jgi:hypothetical protein
MNNMNMGKEKTEAKAHCETTRRRQQQEQTEDILTSHMSNMHLVPQSALMYPS